MGPIGECGDQDREDPNHYEPPAGVKPHFGKRQVSYSRPMVVCDTPKVLAIAVNASPASRRAIASRC
jgi:hypothetical protein